MCGGALAGSCLREGAAALEEPRPEQGLKGGQGRCAPALRTIGLLLERPFARQRHPQGQTGASPPPTCSPNEATPNSAPSGSASTAASSALRASSAPSGPQAASTRARYTGWQGAPPKPAPPCAARRASGRVERASAA